MIITSLKPYKGKTFEVVLNDSEKLYLHVEIVAQFELRVGMKLEKKDLKKIDIASEFRRVHQYALYCLDFRDYSAEEMFTKLMENCDNEKICLTVVKKLARSGLIDDARYAEKLAAKLVEVKKYGYYRVFREMKEKGLDEEIITEVLKSYSKMFPENLAELIRKKHSRKLTDSGDRQTIEKVKNALVRYGYSFDEVNRAVREYFESEERLEG